MIDTPLASIFIVAMPVEIPLLEVPYNFVAEAENARNSPGPLNDDVTVGRWTPLSKTATLIPLKFVLRRPIATAFGFPGVMAKSATRNKPLLEGSEPNENCVPAV